MDASRKSVEQMQNHSVFHLLSLHLIFFLVVAFLITLTTVVRIKLLSNSYLVRPNIT